MASDPQPAPDRTHHPLCGGTHDANGSCIGSVEPAPDRTCIACGWTGDTGHEAHIKFIHDGDPTLVVVEQMGKSFIVRQPAPDRTLAKVLEEDWPLREAIALDGGFPHSVPDSWYDDLAARLAAADVRVVTVERLARAHGLVQYGEGHKYPCESCDKDAAAILAALDAEP